MSLAIAYEYYTYEDYKHWKGDWELIGGVAYAMAPSPVISHQSVMSAIVAQWFFQLKDCNECLVLSEEDWKISDDTVLRPDVMIVCNNLTQNYVSKTPEIVVEIVSSSTARRDEKIKFKIYEQERVKYYILVYPKDKKAKIYKLNNKFEKIGDFTNEVYEFNDVKCRVSLDFNLVFKKL